MGAEPMAQTTKILFLGDSLTEGYGINKKKSYPEVVKKLLAKKNLKIEIINGSVSGSTTASCSSRLRWFSKGEPDYVFIALGGNDGLRGIPVKASFKNLRECSKMALEKGIKVMLTGMMVPPNYGPDYTSAFKGMYPKISKELKAPLMPFLLVDVAAEQALNQEDGIHPNEKGHEVMGKNVALFFEGVFKKSRKK